jgi:DNA-binding transcriptional LysR family regulator
VKIDFDALHGFVLVAELGGFSKAATQLHVTQTALTRRIQRLESYLDVRLLDRTTRSVHLTAIGREFLPQARRLVDEMTSAVTRLRDMSRLGKGNITVASIPTMAHYALPAVMREYSMKHPGNRIRIIDCSASEVGAAVLSDLAEFGITIQLERRAELSEEAILREPFMFFCREEHALSGNKAIAWEEVTQTDLIVVSRLSGNRALLDHQLARRGLILTSTYEVDHLSTAIGLVSAGVGAAVLPFSTIQEGTNPMVRRIPLVRPVISRTIVLVRRKNGYLSPATQIFYDMLARQLKATGREVTARPSRGAKKTSTNR